MSSSQAPQSYLLSFDPINHSRSSKNRVENCSDFCALLHDSDHIFRRSLLKSLARPVTPYQALWRIKLSRAILVFQSDQAKKTGPLERDSMYGLVNEGIRDMVVAMAGTEAWESISQEAGVDSAGFEPLCPYDDSLTYKLVDLVSRRFELAPEDVLRRYGRYWITYTATQGYGEIMLLFGSDFRSCLENLNRMHGHMGAMMPQLSPPRFQLEVRGPTDWLVHYYSHRHGLGPMVTGLLEGLAEKYKERVSIRHITKGTRSDHDEFEVSFEPA